MITKKFFILIAILILFLFIPLEIKAKNKNQIHSIISEKIEIKKSEEYGKSEKDTKEKEKYLAEKNRDKTNEIKKKGKVKDRGKDDWSVKAFYIWEKWGLECLFLSYMILIIFILFLVIFTVCDMEELTKRVISFMVSMTISSFLIRNDNILIGTGRILTKISLVLLFFISLVLGSGFIALLDVMRWHTNIKKNMEFKIFILIVPITLALQTTFYYKYKSLQTTSSIISLGMIVGASIYYVFFFKSFKKRIVKEEECEILEKEDHINES